MGQLLFVDMQFFLNKISLQRIPNRTMTFILDIQYFVAISIYIISVLILSMTISMFGLSVPVVNSFALVSAGVEGWGNSAGQGGGGVATGNRETRGKRRRVSHPKCKKWNKQAGFPRWE